MTSKHVRVEWTDEDRARHAQARREVEADRPRFDREARKHFAERESLIDAFRRLEARRARLGKTAADVAEGLGMTAEEYERLAADPYPPVRLGLLLQLAEALGVRLTLGIDDRGAA